jgi:hypothetical protein
VVKSRVKCIEGVGILVMGVRLYLSWCYLYLGKSKKEFLKRFGDA